MSEKMDSQNEILAEYADGPNQLEAAIAGLPKTGLDTALSSDSWTIREIIHHVADGDDIWKMFIKRAIGNSWGEFTLDWYWQIPQDEWAGYWTYEKRAIEPSLTLFRANRNHIVQLLMQIPESWEKCLHVRWPRGEEQVVSVHWVVEMQARHVLGHVNDVTKIREAYNI